MNDKSPDPESIHHLETEALLAGLIIDLESSVLSMQSGLERLQIVALHFGELARIRGEVDSLRKLSDRVDLELLEAKVRFVEIQEARDAALAMREGAGAVKH